MLTPTQKQIENFHTKYQTGDGCWEWIGYKRPNGYGAIYMSRSDGPPSVTTAQRAAYSIHKGPIPNGLLVDHICRNPGCVNPDHLRLATFKQNNENRGPNKASKTGLKGVSWHKGERRWNARMTHNGVMYRLGSYSTAEEAYAVVVAKRNELFTHNDVDRVAS